MDCLIVTEGAEPQEGGGIARAWVEDPKVYTGIPMPQWRRLCQRGQWRLQTAVLLIFGFLLIILARHCWLTSPKVLAWPVEKFTPPTHYFHSHSTLPSLSLYSSFTLTPLFRHSHSTLLSLSLYSSFTLTLLYFHSYSIFLPLSLNSFTRTPLFLHSLHSSFTHSTLLSLSLHSSFTLAPLSLLSYSTLNLLILHSTLFLLHSTQIELEWSVVLNS